MIHTIEINELILNAVALEFVLLIDDFLFVCFVPTRIRALAAATCSCRRRRKPASRGW